MVRVDVIEELTFLGKFTQKNMGGGGRMQNKEHRGVRAFLTIRIHQINLLPSSNFLPKIVPFTATVPFTYFMGYSESIL